MKTEERTTCPVPAELQALVDSHLRDDERPALADHLESCPTCQQRLQDLAADSGIWRRARRHLREGDTHPGKAFERVVASLEGHGPDTQSMPDTDAPAALDFLEPADRPGDLGRLAHYAVQNVIGRGGMGVVLKAFDERLQRTVAIKVLAPHRAADATARRRFVREAQALAAVRDEHVIEVHAVHDEGLPFMVMNYVAGSSLQERLDRLGPLDIKETVRIGLAVATGLAAAHAQGLVHRDVKPANILVEEATGKVKLTDFGLARAVDDASLPHGGEIAGTPPYMAPEQAGGGAVDHRADLFSLGSVLYALCTGQPPFTGMGGTTMVLREVHAGCPKPVRDLNPQVPDWLAAIITKLHALKPADRYQSATEVADILRRRLAQLQRPVGRLGRRGWFVAAAAIVLAAGGLTTWLGWKPPEELHGNKGGPPAPPPIRLGPPRVLFVLAFKDFYYPEYISVQSVLTPQGIHSVIASSSAGEAVPDDPTGKGEGEPVPVEVLIKDARAKDYDAIYFCGGKGAMEYAEGGAHAAEARRLIAEAQAAGRIIAAHGSGPVILAEAGVLRGRRATCYKYGQLPKEYIRRLERAGATWVDEPFVVSVPFLTGQNPEHIREFARALGEMVLK